VATGGGDATVELGRKTRGRSTPAVQSRNIAAESMATVTENHDRAVNKERSKSRESLQRNRRHPKSTLTLNTAVESDSQKDLQMGYSGPLATAEFTRLKKENEELKKVCIFFSNPNGFW
jgi:hypothetical protein